MLLCKIAILSSALIYGLVSFCHNYSTRDVKVEKPILLHDIQALIKADSVQTGLFCHLTKKSREFLDVQLTDMYGSCVVELMRSCLQEVTLLTTEYLCTTPIDFHQFH